MKISSLHMQNFRAHSETRIDLAPEDKLVVVHGPNGSGKSSVLEAILYSLYGESRSGPRGRIDRLVKRGREIEGLSVMMEFGLRGDMWKVIRERDRSRTAAVLYRDDQSYAEGTRAVSSELVGILGHDAKSFRLAYLAEQKELDALGKMGPAERRRQVERFLSLDVIMKAATAQKSEAKSLRSSLDDLPRLVDLAPVREEASRLRQLAVDKARELELAAAVLDAANSDVEELQAASRHWAGRREALAAAQARHEMAKSALETAASAASEARKATEGVDLSIGTAETMDSARATLGEARDALTDARELNAGLKGRRQAAADLEAVRTRIASTEKLLGNRSEESETARRDAAAEAYDAAQSMVRERTGSVGDCRDTVGGSKNAVSAAEGRLREVQSLSASCLVCHQEVSEDHRHVQEELAASALCEAREAEGSALAALTAAESALEEAVQTESAARAELSNANASLSEAVRLTADLETDRRREATLEQRAGTGDVSGPVDLGPLQKAVDDAEASVEASRKASALAITLSEAVEALQHTKEAESTAAAEAAAAELPSDAAAADEKLSAAVDAQNSAVSKHRALYAAAAEASAAADNAERLKKEAVEGQRRRKRRVEKTEVAFRASGLLDWLAREIGKVAAPQLESYASHTLHKITAGMFHRVSFDETYSPTVYSSSGQWEFQDLSGGEQDAVALSVRLAAADLADSWSAADPSDRFLVLDEPLGSQDAERRESLVDYLQALKSEYGQIWCISHIGELHEIADRMVELQRVASGEAATV